MLSLDEHWKNTVPTYVAWTEDDERVFGKRDKGNGCSILLFNVKRVIGREEFEQQVQDEKPRTPFAVVKVPEDR